ncbi:SDR family oxidoreductase [Synechococcus elongatus]|uniref:NAD(P)H-binding protein n=1 Tax=Synechococcus elongatus PCC 11802 TaxID=2283154 RepID=A0AAT9JNI2_SYNEL|nr:NAD(P)H-binding protein [Synechococcus elongatus]QFZ92457.1 NAD-dependent epimerase/dehydratase family protein [Synechococcus elongatus PCC 11802]
MQPSNILVTGGTGFLGSQVVARLQTADCNVQVLSRSERPDTVQADLLTGEGLAQAVAGIDTIIHCASSPSNPHQVDVEGTKRLLQVAEKAGVSHIVYISIVGVDRNPFYPYYGKKLEAERIIEKSSVSWTILRATQFYEFVLMLIQALDRLPVMLMPKDFLLQPIQASEVADRLVELALASPAGHVTDIGGPKVWTAAELARAYFKVIGRKRSIIEIPIPGKAAKAFRTGAQLCPDQKYGNVDWEMFLNQQDNL